LIILSVHVIGSGRKGMAPLHVGMGHRTARVTSDDVENKNKTREEMHVLSPRPELDRQLIHVTAYN
jgi:hypothetical protein